MIDLDRGACREAELTVFFPEDDAAQDHARSICARCEIRLDCLALALRTPNLDGIWGGLSTRERARFRVDRPITRRNAS
jgi:WhiB family redox-sensing transcriptional regulator